MLTLLVGSIGTLFATASSPPGIAVIANALLPFNYGFQKLFGGSLELQGLLSMPAVYGTAYGFMFCVCTALRVLTFCRDLSDTFCCCVRALRSTAVRCLRWLARACSPTALPGRTVIGAHRTWR